MVEEETGGKLTHGGYFDESASQSIHGLDGQMTRKTSSILGPVRTTRRTSVMVPRPLCSRFGTDEQKDPGDGPCMDLNLGLGVGLGDGPGVGPCMDLSDGPWYGPQ